MDSKYAKQVNKMIDLGASYPEIRKYLKSKDFNISETYIGKYKRIRQSLTAEENSLEDFMKKSPVSKLIESQEKEMDDRGARHLLQRAGEAGDVQSTKSGVQRTAELPANHGQPTLGRIHG